MDGGHTWQLVEPLIGVKYPTEQLLQDPAPSITEKVPGEHSEQTEDPAMLELPAEQLKHSVDPLAEV